MHHSMHCSTRRSVLCGLAMLLACAATGTAEPQNPISSKLVGSDVARRNRQLLAEFRERHHEAERRADSVQQAFVRRPGTAEERRARYLAEALPTAAERRLAAMEMAEQLKVLGGDSNATAPSQPTCVASAIGAEVVETTAGSEVYHLEQLCIAARSRAAVHEALRLEFAEALTGGRSGPILTAERAGALRTSDAEFRVLAWRSLIRVLKAVEKGHLNPQRWYLGGQFALLLMGPEEGGVTARASARAAYFIPISPLRRFQLPVVTNLTSIGAAPPESRESQLRRLNTSAEGAFLSMEPTFDPIIPGAIKDVRFQPFVALGGQVNTLRDRTDSTTVQFAQGKFGVGTNLEIGVPGDGLQPLFFTTRAVRRAFSAVVAERAFGAERLSPWLVESMLLIPLGSGLSIVGEVTASPKSPPVVRFALWSQAAP